MYRLQVSSFANNSLQFLNRKSSASMGDLFLLKYNSCPVTALSHLVGLVAAIATAVGASLAGDGGAASHGCVAVTVGIARDPRPLAAG